jgi:hypothetical protein
MVADFHAHAIARFTGARLVAVLLLSSFVLLRLQQTTNQPLLEE